jgi:chemotaxis protein MotB
MAGKGGGAWKVAYADFVTAMMAFFLVMWIVGQSENMKEAIAHHFNDPFAKESDEDGTAHQRPPKHPAPARVTDRPEHEKEAGGSHSVLLSTQGGQRTSIGTVIHFADDSAELDDEGRRRLAEISPLLVGKPQKIEVRGHSSRRPLPPENTFGSHWKLCYDRCLAVMTELERLGIPHERLRLSQAAGYEPLSSPSDQLSGGGYSRVEVTLLNETTGVTVAEHIGAKAAPAIKQAKHAPQSGGHAADKHDSPAAKHDPHGPGHGHGSDAHKGGSPPSANHAH